MNNYNYLYSINRLHTLALIVNYYRRTGWVPDATPTIKNVNVTFHIRPGVE